MEQAKFSLKDFLEKNKITLYQASLIINHLIKAVSKLHKMGYVHNDIQLSNIFIYNNFPVLADYGEAKKLNKGEENDEFDKKQLFYLFSEIS